MITIQSIFIGKFRKGQFPISEAKEGEVLALVHDGDITTYAYSLPSYISLSEFESLIGVAFGKVGEEDKFSIQYK